jgi:hypothetical protein
MIRTKKTTPFWGLLLAAVSILLSSCAQDAVFYTIQYDKVLNKNAAVPGSPGKIVKVKDSDDALYTGSNAVYRYKNPGAAGGAASWQRLPDQPGGKRIMDLAGTDSYLYALVMQGVNLSESGLYRKKNPHDDDTEPWEGIANPTGFPIQSLHGAGDTLFAGARAGNGNYVLLYVNETSLTQIPGVSGILKAAAQHSGKYYAALEGTGLLAANTAAGLQNASPLSHNGEAPGNFAGLVEVGGHLIAVSSGGLIWQIDNNGVVTFSKDFETSLNGVVAKWKEPDPNIGSGNEKDLLLLGRAVSGGNSTATYYYGYSELPVTFPSGAPVLGTALQDPGVPGENASTSVSNNNSYYNTLGTHPVVSLYQAPWDGILFASTQQDGLWSCRPGPGGDPKEWNVE